LAYNEILVGRLNRFLQKYLSMKGDAPSVQLAADWQPTIQFDAGVELRYLQGWNRYAIAVTVNGVAANTSGFRFRNPSTSNVIAVIERIVANNTLVAATDFWNMQHGPSAADLATIVSSAVARLDPRGSPQPACVSSVQNTTPALPALSSVILNLSIPAATGFELIANQNQEVPVLPGEAYQFQPNTVNTQFAFSIWWRERFLEESERF
jgi:hypothetical protein